MPTAIVTGSGGLIGSESVSHFVQAGYRVLGLENDMRAQFFGADASTAHATGALRERYAEEFCSLEIDIRDAEGVERAFVGHAGDIELVIHTAAQIPPLSPLTIGPPPILRRILQRDGHRSWRRATSPDQRSR
jgi:CDP-paratose 2-epimerase